MELILTSKLKFKSIQSNRWWKSNDHLQRIFDYIEDLKIFKFNYVYDYSNFYKLDSTRDIKNWYSKLDESELEFKITPVNNEDEVYDLNLNISLNSEELEIGLITNDVCNSNYNKLISLGEWLIDYCKDFALFGPVFAINYFDEDLSYPRLRPMRNFRYFGDTFIVNFMDPLYFESNAHLKLDGMEKIFNEELPANIRRFEYDRAKVIQWVDTVENKSQVEKALMKKEEWLYENVSLGLDSNFNDFGDKIIFNISELKSLNEEDSYFTYYHPQINAAFKVYTLDANDSIDSETEKEVAKYLDRGVLENGDPIKLVLFITSVRERALAIKAKAKEIGVYKVLYLDENLDVWDMDPVGNWRN